LIIQSYFIKTYKRGLLLWKLNKLTACTDDKKSISAMAKTKTIKNDGSVSKFLAENETCAYTSWVTLSPTPRFWPVWVNIKVARAAG